MPLRRASWPLHRAPWPLHDKLDCGRVRRRLERARHIDHDDLVVLGADMAVCTVNARCRASVSCGRPNLAEMAETGYEQRQVLYSIAKHAMRRSADEIGATSISFRPKVFSDPASVVDRIFSAHRVCTTRINRAHGA